MSVNLLCEITRLDQLVRAKPCLILYSIDTYFIALTTDTAFENIVGKEEIARNEQFLLFPQCFLLNQKIVSPFFNVFDIISLFAAEMEEPKIGICGKGLTLYQTISSTFRRRKYLQTI